MPTVTFYNLSSDKQKNIYDAAREEFTRVSFNDASINKIINKAGISRGSFYQYFTDKEDIYCYVLDKEHSKLAKVIKNLSEKTDGNIFEIYKELFLDISNKMIKGSNKNFVRMIMFNMDFKSNNFMPKPKSSKHPFTDIIKYFNLDSLNVKSDEDVFVIIDMFNIILIHNLVMMLKLDVDLMCAYNKFNAQLSILKDGLYRKEMNNDKNI